MLHITITEETESGIKTICDCDTENAICVVGDDEKTSCLSFLKGGAAVDLIAHFINLHEMLKKEMPYKIAKCLAWKLRTEERIK